MRFARFLMPLSLLVGAAAMAADAPTQRSTLADDPLRKISVSVKNNRLVFATRADYERAVNESSPDVSGSIFERLQGLAGFTSLAATANAMQRTAVGGPTPSLITDAHLRAILNPDLVLQIGDSILKVDPASEKVYVLPAAHEAEYADLVAERTSNPNIRQFSTNDDVLDLLAPDQAPQRCEELGLEKEKVSTGGITFGADSMEGEVKYTALGFYYSLAAMITIPGRNSNARATVDLAPVYYHVRCGGTTGPYSVSNYYLGTDGVYQSYQGARRLSAVCMRARFHGETRNSSNVVIAKADSGWIDVCHNYTPPTNSGPDGLDYPHNPTTYIVGQYSLSKPTLARGPATSWSITPPLPAGLVLNPTTGVIDGVPTTAALAADRTVTAANAYGSTTKLLHMAAVKPPVPPSSITYPANPAIYVVNHQVLSQPTYSGGKPTSWSVTPALPPGLNLASGFDPSLGTGYIWGVPTTPQALKPYTIAAYNAGGSTSVTLRIEVRDPATPLSGLTYSENPATYTAGKPIATNRPSLASGVPFSGFSVTPTLPDGLTLSQSTGEIWGTPAHSQSTRTYTVTAHGSTALPGASVQLRITVVEQPPIK